MALRKILTQGDPALAKTCRPVEKFDRKLHWLLDDMKETLANAGGVGLAAPQIGILRRVVVVEDAEENMIELVNPVIVSQSGEQEGWEGCLSVPGKYGWVERPNVVTVRAQDRNGNFFESTGEELVARCFCHELEHLDGHLFVEHADELFTPEEIDAMEAEEESQE
ncbi:MAG: peptide deformylase [Oscillospiraceae bacterium]|nr:peptide deformylase [Oscillospiraceae bacterium]MDE7172341.1 peptide deformylase [Oscillospiraceae bacterium]